jgi:hypothetical protein
VERNQSRHRYPGERPRTTYYAYPEELAHRDALAEKEGAAHADRVLEILAMFPGEAAEEILTMGERALDGILDNVTGVLRKHTGTPESEIEHFAELVRAAYGARLVVALMPAEGRGLAASCRRSRLRRQRIRSPKRSSTSPSKP